MANVQSLTTIVEKLFSIYRLHANEIFITITIPDDDGQTAKPVFIYALRSDRIWATHVDR